MMIITHHRAFLLQQPAVIGNFFKFQLHGLPCLGILLERDRKGGVGKTTTALFPHGGRRGFIPQFQFPVVISIHSPAWRETLYHICLRFASILQSTLSTQELTAHSGARPGSGEIRSGSRWTGLDGVRLRKLSMQRNGRISKQAHCQLRRLDTLRKLHHLRQRTTAVRERRIRRRKSAGIR